MCAPESDSEISCPSSVSETFFDALEIEIAVSCLSRASAIFCPVADRDRGPYPWIVVTTSLIPLEALLLVALRQVWQARRFPPSL